jgi:hypothetical protein
VVHWDNRGGIALFLLPDSPGRNRCKEIANRISSILGEAFCMVFNSGKAGYFAASGLENSKVTRARSRAVGYAR